MHKESDVFLYPYHFYPDNLLIDTSGVIVPFLLLFQIKKSPTHVNMSPETENVNVELSKETLDTMLDGLGKIRDQLASVATRWTLKFFMML